MRIPIVILLLAAPLAASAAPPPRSEVLGRADLPSQVDTAFARQAGEHGLAQIRRVVDSRGRTIYTAQIAGTDRTVEVAPSGHVLSGKP